MAFDKLPGIDYSARAEEEERGRRRVSAASFSRDEPSSRDTYGIEQAARRAWEQSASLREEFTCLESFIAFRKAEARGAVRILSRKT
jgi:hypothetical protein